MDKSGVSQEISSMFFDSVPEMCIVLGDANNLTYQRISLNTVIEYLNGSEWVEGFVSGCDTVIVGEESVTLAVNTAIRVKDQPDIVGSLSLDKEFSSLDYSSKDLQILNNLVYKSGVFKSMFFGEIQATGGMQITLTSSLAVIDGIVVFFETPQNVVLKPGYSTVRKDLIVIRKDQANRVSYVTVLEGIPSVNPRVPELTQNAFGVYEIPIAIITVQPNAVSLSSGDIEDVRELSLNLPELNHKINNLMAQNISYSGIGITSKASNVKEALYAVSEAQLIISDGQEHFTGRYYQNANGGRKPIYYISGIPYRKGVKIYSVKANDVELLLTGDINFNRQSTGKGRIGIPRFSFFIGDGGFRACEYSISLDTVNNTINIYISSFANESPGNVNWEAYVCYYYIEYIKNTDSWEY